jgi:hypothetical protein
MQDHLQGAHPIKQLVGASARPNGHCRPFMLTGARIDRPDPCLPVQSD